MEQMYAEALLEALEKGIEPQKAVAQLKDALQKKGRVKLLPRIAHAIRRLAENRSRMQTMRLTVARQKDMTVALKAAEACLAEAGIKETDLVETVDDTLIGGWRLEGRGILLDASWKKDLLSIYTSSTK